MSWFVFGFARNSSQITFKITHFSLENINNFLLKFDWKCYSHGFYVQKQKVAKIGGWSRRRCKKELTNFFSYKDRLTHHFEDLFKNNEESTWKNIPHKFLYNCNICCLKGICLNFLLKIPIFMKIMREKSQIMWISKTLLFTPLEKVFLINLYILWSHNI